MTGLTQKLNHRSEELNRWLATLNKEQTILGKCLALLDRDCPKWKEKYDLSPTDFTAQDIRREYFRNLAVILQNVRLSFIFMRDQLCDPDWWLHFEGQLQETQIGETISGYETMARQSCLDQVSSNTEHTLTNIAFSGHGLFTLKSSSGLENASSYVLRKTRLTRKYKGLFELLRLFRNTIHSNGLFFPEKPANTQRTYQGKTYLFNVGRPVEYNNETMCLIFRWMGNAMLGIITSPAVSSIPFVGVFQPRPIP